jgi:hypothetical protein
MLNAKKRDPIPRPSATASGTGALKTFVMAAASSPSNAELMMMMSRLSPRFGVKK